MSFELASNSGDKDEGCSEYMPYSSYKFRQKSRFLLNDFNETESHNPEKSYSYFNPTSKHEINENNDKEKEKEGFKKINFPEYKSNEKNKSNSYMINKANNVCVYFKSWDKLTHFINHIEICPGDNDVDMSPEEESKGPNSNSNNNSAENDMNDFETPQSMFFFSKYLILINNFLFRTKN